MDSMLDNAYRNFSNWRDLRGFSDHEIRQQMRNFSEGELSLTTVKGWEIGSVHHAKRKSKKVFMHLIVILADMMSVNPIELISGEIDVRKL